MCENKVRMSPQLPSKVLVGLAGACEGFSGLHFVPALNLNEVQ